MDLIDLVLAPFACALLMLVAAGLLIQSIIWLFLPRRLKFRIEFGVWPGHADAEKRALAKINEAYSMAFCDERTEESSWRYEAYLRDLASRCGIKTELARF